MEITRRVLVNVDRCIDCKACFVACFDGHHGEPIIHHAPGPYGFPILCRQCEEPTCVAACPYGAMERDPHGVVLRRLPMCRACWSCVPACPFGAIDAAMVERRVAKCDLCEDRVLAGGRPRCVAACPAGALEFVEVAEADLEQRGLFVIAGRTLGKDLWRRR
ncbi:4Fe-4S ferredoxin [bacterium]|nr:4Fe-4S ferredoxin [bacterium]